MSEKNKIAKNSEIQNFVEWLDKNEKYCIYEKVEVNSTPIRIGINFKSILAEYENELIN